MNNKTDDNLVRQVMFAYSRAVAAKDADAFMQLYDAEVRVFDAWDAWAYEGRDAWRDCVRAWFAGSDGGIGATFDDVRASVATGFATLSAIVTYAAIAEDGTRTRELQNRLTWVLRSDGGAWRIVHEHTSAPIDLGKAKPILRRVP